MNNIEEVKARCRSFWKKENIGRPYLVARAPKQKGFKSLNTYYNRIQATLTGECDALFQNIEQEYENTYCVGEAMPFFSFDICPDQWAGYFGAEIVGTPGGGTSWVRQKYETIGDVDTKLITGPEGYLSKHLEFIRKANAYFDDRILIKSMDAHSNLDTLSALLGPTNLCIDIMDDPETVHTKLDEIDQYYDYIFNLFYDAAGWEHRGMIGGARMYSEGKFAMLQCDFSCMISPDMAREYLIPSMHTEVKTLTDKIYHFDGQGALGHMDDILEIQEIDGLQWVPGVQGPRTVFWKDLLKKIQKTGKTVQIYDWTPQEILDDRDLIPELTVFTINLQTPEECDDLLHRLTLKYR